MMEDGGLRDGETDKALPFSGSELQRAETLLSEKSLPPCWGKAAREFILGIRATDGISLPLIVDVGF